MAIKAILFDLDGTLLPQNQDLFISEYFKRLAYKLSNYGYEPNKFIESLMLGVKAMVKNDGRASNESVFWDAFSDIYGDKVRDDEPILDEFYRNEFQEISSLCGFNEKAAKAVKTAKTAGFRLVVATNPVFPKIANESRLKWAGVDSSDFEFITSYDNSNYSKPNPEYYKEIISRLGVDAKECLMIGNDVRDDMIASTLGMKVFLLTDCLINRKEADISNYPQGGYDDLLAFIKNLK